MENQTRNDEIEIDLLEVFNILISRAWIIIGAGLLRAPTPTASPKFVPPPPAQSPPTTHILNKTESQTVTYSDVQMGTQLTKDYAELINSRYVLEEVIQLLSLDMDYRDMLEMVSVDTPADTRIVSITVEDTDPAQAMHIANSIREAASNHIQNVMDIEAVNVVESANMPTEKASPNVMLWTFAGGLIGVLALCAATLIQYLLDDTVKSSEDVEKYLGLSTLALIPVVTEENNRKKKKKKKRK